MLTVNDQIISLEEKPILTTNQLSQFNEIVKAKKGLAFGGNNPKRLSYLYTPLEHKALSLFNGFFEDRKVFHEFPIKTKDDKGKTHNYHLDFFDLESKTNIEISPSFHLKYNLVKDSDKRREFLLNKLGIEVIHLRANNIKELAKKKKEIKKIINHIRKKKINKTLLDFYFPQLRKQKTLKEASLFNQKKI